MKFKPAILAILAVVVVQAIALATGFYGLLPNFDIPMHFSGGFVMGMLAIAAHHHMTDKHHMKGIPVWYHLLFVLGFVMAVSVCWEFLEYILDNTVVLWYDLPKHQVDLEDTMLDFAMDALGGLSAFYVFKKGL